MISISQARSHLRVASRRPHRLPLAQAPSGLASLEPADVAQLALLLTRSSSADESPRGSYLDAYYVSEQAPDRL